MIALVISQKMSYKNVINVRRKLMLVKIKGSKARNGCKNIK